MSVATNTTPADDQHGPDVSLKVREAQIRQTYAQMVIGAIVNPIAALGVIVVLWPVIAHGRLLVWFGVLLVIQSARLALPFRYRSMMPTGQSALIWGRLQVIINALSGLVWGVTFFLLWPAGLPLYQMILPVVVVALGAAATAGYAPIRISHLLFILLSLVPLVIRFLGEGTSIHMTIGLLVIMYILSLYRLGTNLRRASTEALTTGIRNRELANTLAEEKAKTDSLNAQLREQATALQESEARFRGLSEATFEGIAIHDGGMMVAVNQAVTHLFGYTPAEAIGMYINDLILPEYHAFAAQHRQAGDEKPYEVKGLRKDGSVFPLEVQAKTVPYKGQQARVVAARDISERKQAEAQALKLQLEQERVQILTSFFQDAAHEFRTPLTVVKTAAYIIDQTDEPAQRREHLDQINKQVDRINGLVEGLLLMVRLDTTIDLDYQPVDVNSLLRSISAALNDDFPDKQLDLNYDLADALPPVQADAKLLGQALYALLHNAGRSVSDKGSIAVATAQVNGSLQVIVDDNGIGIDDDVLPYIFERFYRVDKAHESAGFGLGLAIARQIINLHGGEIGAQSQPGAGATFTVDLPLSG